MHRATEIFSNFGVRIRKRFRDRVETKGDKFQNPYGGFYILVVKSPLTLVKSKKMGRVINVENLNVETQTVA